MIPGIEQVEMR